MCRHPLALGALCLAGCVTTYGSGIEPAVLRSAPFYAGAILPDSAVVAYVPVTYQRGVLGPPSTEPSAEPGTPMAALVAALDSCLSRLEGPRRIPTPSGRGPDVGSGCRSPGRAFCDRPEDQAGVPEQWLFVTRPSTGWLEGARQAMAGAGATHLLVVTVELGEYWPAGGRDGPRLAFGTGRTEPLPWHVPLGEPVSVLQLTGAVVDAEGRIVRIGAEGLLARPGNLLLSLVGAQTAIRDEDLRRLLTARRDDLAAAPPVLEEGLEALLAGLLAPPREPPHGSAIAAQPSGPGRRSGRSAPSPELRAMVRR